MSDRKLKLLCKEIISILNLHNFNQAASELNTILNQLDDSDIRCDTLHQLKKRCDAKWLGDYNITALSMHEWWSLLSQTKNAVDQSIKQLQEV